MGDNSLWLFTSDIGAWLREQCELLPRYGRFFIFKMAAVRHLGFLKVQNFNDRSSSEGRHRATFRADRWNRCRNVAFFDFSRWLPSTVLDLFYACLDHPRNVVGGLYRCAKCGCNRHCGFEDLRFSIFCAFGLKMPIHAHFGGVVLAVKMGEMKRFAVLLGMQKLGIDVLWIKLRGNCLCGSDSEREQIFGSQKAIKSYKKK